MIAALLLSLLAAGPGFHVHGHFVRVTGTCNPDGSRGSVRVPVPGQRLVAREGEHNGGRIVADTATGADGAFDLVVGPGPHCVVRPETTADLCLLKVRGAVEGDWSEDIVIFGPSPAACAGPPKFKVEGQVVSAVEPCGDDGQPPRPLAGAKLVARPGRLNEYSPGGVEFEADGQGRFAVELLPGSWCLVSREQPTVTPRTPGAPVQCADARNHRCGAVVEVADAGVPGLLLHELVSCGDPCAPGDPALPLEARGIGRVAAPGGTLHLRGLVRKTKDRWSGVPPPRDRPPPTTPPPAPGETVRVREGSRNTGQPLVAELLTDATGAFDVALRPGTYCVTSGFREWWFRAQPAELQSEDFDPACLARERESCDQVVTLEGASVDAVEVRIRHWNPPSAPCRVRPYSGSYPP